MKGGELRDSETPHEGAWGLIQLVEHDAIFTGALPHQGRSQISPSFNAVYSRTVRILSLVRFVECATTMECHRSRVFVFHEVVCSIRSYGELCLVTKRFDCRNRRSGSPELYVLGSNARFSKIHDGSTQARHHDFERSRPADGEARTLVGVSRYSPHTPYLLGDLNSPLAPQA